MALNLQANMTSQFASIYAAIRNQELINLVLRRNTGHYRAKEEKLMRESTIVTNPTKSQRECEYT